MWSLAVAAVSNARHRYLTKKRPLHRPSVPLETVGLLRKRASVQNVGAEASGPILRICIVWSGRITNTFAMFSPKAPVSRTRS